MRGLGFQMLEDLQNQSEKTGKSHCSIDRGKLCIVLPEQWSSVKSVAEKVGTEELKNYVKSLKDSGDFSGIHHSIQFRASRSIKLVGVGFFGPHEAEVAEYTVSAEIETLKGFHKLMSQIFYGVPAEKGKIFEVFFRNPLLIDANSFYNILFQLDGPKTGICDPKSVQTSVQSDPNKKEVSVGFEFLGGSLQLPRLLYEVMKEN